MPKTPQDKPERFPAQPRTRPLSDGVCIFAPAKLNLNLLVGPARADRYHPLDSIVAKVSFYDEIELRPRKDRQVTIACDGYDCGPADRNLALLAGLRMLELGGRGVDISVMKRIPPGKGLGGGSSDAAAVLMGLNELFRLAVPHETLAEAAAGLGSDVPLFLGPRASRMTGRGEVITPADVPDFAAVLILPDFACSTAEVYRAFDDDPQQMGRQLPDGAISGPVSHWSRMLENQLTAPALRVCPALATLMNRLEAALKQPVHMSGSGSAMFVLCDDADQAAEVAKRMPASHAVRAVVVESNPW